MVLEATPSPKLDLTQYQEASLVALVSSAQEMQTFSHRSPLDFLTLLQAKQTHRHRIMSSLGVMIDRNQIVHLIRVANPTDSPQSMMNSHACYHKSHQLLGVAKICSIKTKQDKWGLRRRYRYQEM